MDANTTAVDALKRAMELERQGIQFYSGAEERTTDTNGKDMFAKLAHDEADHLASLQRQLDALSSGHGWLKDTGAHEVPSLSTEPLFPPTKAAMRARISGHADDIEALHFALELENKSFVLYSDGAKEVSDPAGRAMYEYLAGFEQSHFNLLMLNYESLARYGHYMGVNA